MSRCRYLTFLRLRKDHPDGKLCPTYDIDIAWHTHMAGDPHGYRRDTTALIGEHFSHDDSINDRDADAPLATLQTQTEAVFARAGLRFSEPGGMFRGTPTLLTTAQRAQAAGGAFVGSPVRVPHSTPCQRTRWATARSSQAPHTATDMPLADARAAPQFARPHASRRQSNLVPLQALCRRASS